MVRSVVMPLVVASLIVLSNGDALAKKPCKPVPPADVDLEWYDKASKEGWDSPFSSKMDPQLSAGPSPPEDKSLKYKRCYNIMFNSRLGSFPTPYHCRFNKIGMQSCVLKTKGSITENFIKFYGTMTITKTDNKTYLVGYGCMGGHSNYWGVVVIRDHKLDEKTKDAILEHVKNTLEYSVDPKDMRSDDDPVSHGPAQQVSCDTDTGMTSVDGVQKVQPKPNVNQFVPSNSETKKGKDDQDRRNIVQVLRMLDNPFFTFNRMDEK